MLRTGRGTLRPLWALLYRLAARIYAGYLTRGEDATSYLRSSLVSGDPVYGLADIDLAFVLAGDPDNPGASRSRLRRRRDRIERAVPALGELFDSFSIEERDLGEAASGSIVTCGLGEAGSGAFEARAVYHGPRADRDRMSILERPELCGPTWGWRRLTGRDRSLPSPHPDPQLERIAAWLELQYWWKVAADGCAHPDRASAAYLCVKLVAEAARIWLSVIGCSPAPARSQLLTQALDVLPEEREALTEALRLERSLHSLPRPPFEEFLPAFVRISQRIAQRISEQIAPAGVTGVELDGRDGELLYVAGGWRPEQQALVKTAPRLHPLVDWRALVPPSPPDETFAVIPGDPRDPAPLVAAARAASAGPYPTLLAGNLMIRPTTAGKGRGRLRVVQCAVTDPVSFALTADQPLALFPNVRGWSVSDITRRALAECRAWLEDDRERSKPSGRRLGLLIACARAALLEQSIKERAPALTVTAVGTMRALAEQLGDERAIAEASAEEYSEFTTNGALPASGTVRAMRELILRLPAFDVLG